MNLTDIRTDHSHYATVENLLTEAFPEDERRDLDLQRTIVDTDSRFSCILATEGDEPVGFVTVWDFTRFRYVEHFATMANARNKGYGAQIIGTLVRQSDKPIVLEVEIPDNETARRRICFYQRNGFHLLPYSYTQPPYRQGGNSLPMKLMATAELSEAATARIIATLHREVYKSV